VSIPFVFEISFLPARWKTIMIFPVVFALFFQFRAISFASRPLTERYVTLTEMIDETREKGITKRIVSAQKLEELGIDVHWALPFESIMSSSLQDRDSAVALISSEEIH